MADDTTDVTEVPQDVPAGMTPFTTSTTDPSGATRTVTGYGPRRPIAPPAAMSGGMPIPDLGPAYAAAFRNLPVDQAAKAVEAAMRYQGQRGYMRDLQNGVNTAAAFAKWAPMMFHQATGIPEAIERTIPAPLTAYQKAQLAMPKIHATGGGLYSVGPEGLKTLVAPKPAATKSPTLTDAQKEDLRDAYSELSAARKDQAENSDKTPDDPAMVDAMTRMDEAKRRISRITGPPPSVSTNAPPVATATVKASKAIPTITSKEQWDALEPGEEYRGKDGLHYHKRKHPEQ